MSHEAETNGRDEWDHNETDIDAKWSIELVEPGIRHCRLKCRSPVAVYIYRVEVYLFDSDEGAQEHAEEDWENHVHEDAIPVQEIKGVCAEESKYDAQDGLGLRKRHTWMMMKTSSLKLSMTWSTSEAT